ncbi:MAG: hypothetical protein R6V44_15370 [Paracoccaceae bacterium]
MSETPTFTLGIAMAGAISAGAYTAGVMDFLIRAVRLHNAQLGTPGGPKHRIVIKAMSGASAGGITAALTTAALIEGIPEEGETHEGELVVDGVSHRYRYALRILHEIWVERVDLAVGDGLLGLGDLRGKRPVRSFLDSDVLDRQAGEALGPVRWNGERHDWLAREFELFLTTTTLEGTPFVAPFAAGGGEIVGHPMARHGFARHFRLTGLGTAEIGSPWLEAWGDAGVPLTLPEPGEPVPFELPEDQAGPDRTWNELRLSAFASGAFPAGLAARFMHLTADEFWIDPARVAAGETARGGALPLDIDWALRPTPSAEFLTATPPSALTATAVDGGMVNNEPFELVRFALRPRNPEADPDRPEDRPRFLKRNPTEAQAADRAVIMIDPFPEGPVFEGAEPRDPQRLLTGVVRRILRTLINEARFKPLELLRAADDHVHSRYLITPSRRRRKGELRGVPQDDRRRANLDARGAEAIASGLLGGFGGFVDESFRRHDFILGQRNCQSFLLDYFKVAGNNPFDHAKAPEAPEGPDRPVLHLHPDLVAPVALPPWPRVSKGRLGSLRRAIDRRIDRMMERLIDDWFRNGSFEGGVRAWLARNGYAIVISGRLKRGVRDMLEAALEKRDQA